MKFTHYLHDIVETSIRDIQFKYAFICSYSLLALMYYNSLPEYNALPRLGKDTPHDLPHEDKGCYSSCQEVSLCCLYKDREASAWRDDCRVRSGRRVLKGVAWERQGKYSTFVAAVNHHSGEFAVFGLSTDSRFLRE